MSTDYLDRKKLNSFLFNNQQAAAVLAKGSHRPTNSIAGKAMSYAKQNSEDKAMSSDVHGEFGKLFFDLDVAVEILIGLILSPKGAVRPELIFSAAYEQLPSSAIGAITKQLPRYFNETYALSSGLARMLKKVFYTDGSCARIIIPESVLDKLVRDDSHLTSEMLAFASDPKQIPLKGIMRDPSSSYTFGAEARGYRSSGGSHGMSPYLDTFKLTITDNYELLSLPALRQYSSKRQTESFISPFSNNVDEQWFFSAHEEFVDIGELEPDRQSIGLPLYLEVNSAAITPIPIPGDPTKHTAYLLLLDENGYIVSPKDIREDIQQMYATLPSTPMGKSIANTARPTGGGYGETKLTTDALVDIFMGQVNNQITKMLNAAGQTRDLTFIEVNAMYSSILARAMKSKQTRLLFLPAEMVAYYAFRFDDNGIGETLLSDLPTLSSMRASLLFSGLVSEIKNNIPQTKVNISLDADDPDPENSIEMIQSNTLERQANLMPIQSIVNITDWTEWAYRSGFSFQVEEHPLLPNTKIEYEDVTPQRLIPSDSALYEKIRAQQIMAIGLTPEMVDNGFASDFATTDQAKRIQLARRISTYQMELSTMMTAEVRKLALADGNIFKLVRDHLDNLDNIGTFLTDKYKSMYNKNKELTLDKITIDIIRSLTVELPNPDTDNLAVTLANIQQFNDVLELAMDSWFNTEFFGSSEEEQQLVDNGATIRVALKAHYMREYMIKNGYLTELSEMVSFSDDGTPMIDLEEVMATHVKGLVSMASSYLKEFTPATQPADGITDTPPDDPADVDDTDDEDVDETEEPAKVPPAPVEPDEPDEEPAPDAGKSSPAPPPGDDKVPADLTNPDGSVKLSQL